MPKALEKSDCTKPARVNNPQRTIAEIIKVASQEFASKGYAGVRIEQLAEMTLTSKRMIYYYFGGKDGLYQKVLENAYRKIRSLESNLVIHCVRPEDALKQLVEYSYDLLQANEEYVQIVMNENLQKGQFVSQNAVIKEMSVPLVNVIEDIYRRGIRLGVFRFGLSPVEIHAFIQAMCFFNVSNQHTFGAIFNDKLSSLGQPKSPILSRDRVVELVLNFVQK